MDTWYEDSLICADFSGGKDYFIKGSRSSMIAAVPMLTIVRCSNETLKEEGFENITCHNDTEIDEFLEDL
jgi:hypothetical protein